MKDSSRQMYRELVEQTEKAERLGSENKALRRKIKFLETELSHEQRNKELMDQDSVYSKMWTAQTQWY